MYSSWCVLYCIITNYNKALEIITEAKSEYFLDATARDIYGYILELINKNIAPSLSLIKTKLNEFENDKLDVMFGQIEKTGIDVNHYVEYIKALKDDFTNDEINKLGKLICNQKKTDISEFLGNVDYIINAINGNLESELHYSNILTEQFIRELDTDTVNKSIDFGIPSVDEFADEIDQEDYIIIAARPSMGKSGLLGYIAMHNALIGKPTLIFSLEMSPKQYIKRMFGAASQIELWKFKNKKYRQEETSRITEMKDKFIQMPLMIDNTAGLDVYKMKSVIQKAKIRYPKLGLIGIDYIQLMTGEGETKNLEIASISKNLKSICKQYHIPVIACSQLNRQCELREDNKRPLLSDMRDSGCITKDSLILMQDGTYKTIETLQNQPQNTAIWSINKDMLIDKDYINKIFFTGTKKVYQVKLNSGITIKATDNHPFFTLNGWTQLKDLKLKDRIGVLRKNPISTNTVKWEDEKIIFLAHMLGDGCFRKKTGIGYCNTNEQQIKIVAKASEIFDTIPKYDWQQNARTFQLRFTAKFQPSKKRHNPIVDWSQNLGLLNKLAHEKFVPKEIFQLGKRQIALFLNHIWMTDGSVQCKPNTSTADKPSVYYCSSSYQLSFDIYSLLLKLGIISTIRTVKQGKYRDNYWVVIDNSEEKLKFLSLWDLDAPKGNEAEQAINALKNIKKDTNRDTIPIEIWDRIKNILKENNISYRRFAKMLGIAYNGTSYYKNCPSRRRIEKIANILQNDQLKKLAQTDILWDKIVSIEYSGEQEVYDIETKHNHNFIANNIILHNSIEQDADIVIAMYRDSYYTQSPDDEKICELLFRKYRNGATGKVIIEYNRKTQAFASLKPNTDLWRRSQRFQNL